MGSRTGALFKATGTVTKVLAVMVVALVVGAVTVLLVNGGTKSGVAYFASVKNVYPKDRVRIQGVDVGEITAIEPQGDSVKVSFTYDSKYDLPADVKGAIISPTLVATRFLQLAPAYTGGPALADGGVIPEDRTASPLEFDDLKKELGNISSALGPEGIDKDGALKRFADTVAANAAGGQGARFNEMVRQASAAVQTLTDGREDIFGTVRNLQAFVTALSALDDQIVEFNGRLSTVSSFLNDNTDELTQALQGIDAAAKAVDEFVDTNGAPLNTAVDKLGHFTRTLANSRDDLATILHVGPSTLMNLFNIYSPRSGSLSGALVVDNLNTPADFICSAYSVAYQSVDEGVKSCKSYLGPLLNVLRVQQPPVGVNPLLVPGGGANQPDPGPIDPAPPVAEQPAQLPPPVDVPGLGGLLVPNGGN
ncbi:MCE family protein [Pseudonocardia sp. RS11V-5]|uniref:MCE family protein n=1 Tax=Pseudonocardia terrae TaxID=2905831 RepID=UPI001E54E995|nr:MCE family protein [Pseudonocardia terrae]MCE3550804.1 MCE family protein [Pseudonocardia terrae]